MHFSNSLNETHLYFPIQMYLISWGYILLVYCTCVHWGEVMLRFGRLLRLYTIQPHFENKQKPKSHTLNTQWPSTRIEDLTKSVFTPRSIVFFFGFLDALPFHANIFLQLSRGHSTVITLQQNFGLQSVHAALEQFDLPF